MKNKPTDVRGTSLPRIPRPLPPAPERHPKKKPESPFAFEMRESGWHRIVAPDGSACEWVPYSSVARLDWRGKTYVAFSAYWMGCLEIEKVFSLQTEFSVSQMAQEHHHVFDSALSVPERFSGVLRPDMIRCECGAMLFDAGSGKWQLYV